MLLPAASLPLPDGTVNPSQGDTKLPSIWPDGYDMGAALAKLRCVSVSEGQMHRVVNYLRKVCRRTSAVPTVLAALLVATSCAVADEPPAATDKAKGQARTLIEAMLREREKIKSAIVHVQGTEIGRFENEPPVRPIRAMYAFDFPHGLLRFDSSKRMYVRMINADKIATAGNNLKLATAMADGELFDVTLRYVRNREYSASWDREGRSCYSSVHLRPVDGQMGGLVAAMHHLIDLRSCGLMTYREFRSGAFEKGTNVADYCKALLELPVSDVTEKDGLAVITARTEHADYRLTIDTKRRHSPVEYRMSWKKGPGNSADGSQISRVEWHDVSGVRVPKACTIEFHFNQPGEEIHNRCHFEYDWQNVNEPIAPSYFDYKSFTGIPLGAGVVDMRKQPIRTIGVWKEEGAVGPEDESDDVQLDLAALEASLAADRKTRTTTEGRRAGEERDDNVLQMKLVWCPPGEFSMGSRKTEKNDSTAREPEAVNVRLTRGFWLGKYEVTQAQWLNLKKPAFWKGEQRIREGDDHPATYLSWENAMAFCRRLTEYEGRSGRLPEGWEYTLPTEAQWEYACRAGTTTQFSFGDDESQLDEYAWFRKNASDAGENYAHPVGTKKPNLFGLHDMHGNVWEWCRDGGQTKLLGGTDPVIAPRGETRVMRGGSFGWTADMCRSSTRGWHDAVQSRDNLFGDLGFRVALCPRWGRPISR